MLVELFGSSVHPLAADGTRRAGRGARRARFSFGSVVPLVGPPFPALGSDAIGPVQSDPVERLLDERKKTTLEMNERPQKRRGDRIYLPASVLLALLHLARRPGSRQRRAGRAERVIGGRRAERARDPLQSLELLDEVGLEVGGAQRDPAHGTARRVERRLLPA